MNQDVFLSARAILFLRQIGEFEREHGHSHGATPAKDKRLDVGVDALKTYAPIAMEEIV